MSKTFFKEYFKFMQAGMESVNKDNLIAATETIQAVSQKGKKLIIVGNGGSAAMASHVSIDFTKAAGIRAINFNEADLLTCFSNAYGYERVFEKTVEFCHREMKQMEMTFNELSMEYIPSAANFLTIVFHNEEEAESFNNAMLHKGIILRHLKSWGLSNCIRITIGTKKENLYFLQQLSSILSKS